MLPFRLSPPDKLSAAQEGFIPKPLTKDLRIAVGGEMGVNPREWPSNTGSLVSGGGRRAVGDNTHGAHADKPLMPWGPSHISLSDASGDCPGSGIHSG